MSVNKIAERLSREHFELNLLMERLLECVDFMPRVNESNWIDNCRSVYDEFRIHLLKHMDLEETGGYMSEVAARRPQLITEVDRLKVEHQSLRHLIDSLSEAVKKLTPQDSLLIRDFCHRIRDLIGYIRHHENDENMTVLSAFTDDIGTKD